MNSGSVAKSSDAAPVREAVYRVFADAEPSGEDLALVGEAAARAAGERRLLRGPDGYEYGWPESERLEQLLWPVALSAADLITSEDRTRVKDCAAEDCNWLFLDTSRNRSRRWCDMRVCGNRAKARRFQARSQRPGE